MNLIIIGAPGSGKGTQANKIVKDFKIAHISTGNLLREAVEKKTPEGIIAKDLIENGKFVKDELIFKMLSSKLAEPECKNGFLLDGVPRNLTQIEFVERFGIDKLIYIDVDFDEIKKRLTQRRICSKCQATFNEKDCKNGICPICGGKMFTRDDDRLEVVEKRLETYKQVTLPVVNYYKKTGKLITVNGNQSVDDVYREIYKELINDN